MRRARHQGTLTRHAQPPAATAKSVRGRFDPPREFAECSTSRVESAPVDVLRSTTGTVPEAGSIQSEQSAERKRQLAVAIMQRIESRLPGRVRNLVVRIRTDTVVLEGQCATYYTKQLAQHAALGILEDEHLENAIVVAVGR